MAAMRDCLVPPKVMPVRSGHHHIPNAFHQEISPSLATPRKTPRREAPFSHLGFLSIHKNQPAFLCDLSEFRETQYLLSLRSLRALRETVPYLLKGLTQTLTQRVGRPQRGSAYAGESYNFMYVP
jgi:hypothetical protein